MFGSSPGIRSTDADDQHAGSPFDLGLGWFRPATARTATPTFVQHRGDGGAFATDMRIYPDAALGVVMMGNATTYDRDAISRICLQVNGSRAVRDPATLAQR